MQHNSYRRWITLAIISFSGGVSFDLAYLRYIYQIPMAKFIGFWICPYISRHLLSLNPLLACCRRYSRGER